MGKGGGDRDSGRLHLWQRRGKACVRQVDLRVCIAWPPLPSAPVPGRFDRVCPRQEVEEEVAGGKGRKRRREVTGMQYQYNPDLEGTYQRSLNRSFCKAAVEARHAFLIMDAPNLRLADFREAWSGAQAAGYEVWVASLPQRSPQVCAKHSTHGRSLEELEQLAAGWEELPPGFQPISLQRFMFGGGEVAEVEMESDEGPDHAAARGDAGAGARWTRGGGEAGQMRESVEGAAGGTVASPEAGVGLEPAAQKAAPPGILKKAGASPRRNRHVVWADHAASLLDEDSGFQMPGSRPQLEHVRVLEGLGPAHEGDVLGAGTLPFAEAAAREHSVERRGFRDILLGHGSMVGSG
uniref:Uncharacterized protein n=1 Tax=Auxenochlorella protothecoides TaxID=3075 RepID=A0A1D1ZV70_AUXPR